MSRREITDQCVVIACKLSHARQGTAGRSIDFLMEMTGQTKKVCYAAMKLAHEHECIEFGVSLETSFPTAKGLESLEG